ncbi:MAG: GNAT family protein [Mycobacteriales bacterium]
MFADGEIALRPLVPDDLPARYAWRIDTQTHLISDSRPLLPITWERFVEHQSGRVKSPDHEDFTITRGGQQVGYCQLVLYDNLARSAMLGISLAPDARGQHIGRRACELLLDHAFRDRGLHRVWLGTSSINEAGQRAYRAAGFIEETRERERSWVDGRYVDEIRMGILRREWEARRGEHAQG